MAPWPRDDGLVEVTVGAGVDREDARPGGQGAVTVGDRDVARSRRGRTQMVMLAVSEVALTKVVELTVIPVPEKEVARGTPVTKLVPVIVMVWLVAP